MKKVTRIEEIDLSQVVRRVINELQTPNSWERKYQRDIERLQSSKVDSSTIINNKLYNDLKDVIANSISGKQEIISVLKYILDEEEGRGFVTKDKVLKNFRK